MGKMNGAAPQSQAHLAIAGGGHCRGEIDSLLPGQLTWLNVPFSLPAIAFVP